MKRFRFRHFIVRTAYAALIASVLVFAPRLANAGEPSPIISHAQMRAVVGNFERPQAGGVVMVDVPLLHFEDAKPVPLQNCAVVISEYAIHSDGHLPDRRLEFRPGTVVSRNLFRTTRSDGIGPHVDPDSGRISWIREGGETTGTEIVTFQRASMALTTGGPDQLTRQIFAKCYTPPVEYICKEWIGTATQQPGGELHRAHLTLYFQSDWTRVTGHLQLSNARAQQTFVVRGNTALGAGVVRLQPDKGTIAIEPTISHGLRLSTSGAASSQFLDAKVGTYSFGLGGVEIASDGVTARLLGPKGGSHIEIFANGKTAPAMVLTAMASRCPDGFWD